MFSDVTVPVASNETSWSRCSAFTVVTLTGGPTAPDAAPDALLAAAIDKPDAVTPSSFFFRATVTPMATAATPASTHSQVFFVITPDIPWPVQVVECYGKPRWAPRRRQG